VLILTLSKYYFTIFIVQPLEVNGYCTNIVTDVLFEILYAKTGYFANPQNQVRILKFFVHYLRPVLREF